MEIELIDLERVATTCDFISFRVPGRCRGFVTDLLSKEKPGMLYRVTVSNSKPRSTGVGSQAAHFNGHCRQIAAAVGCGFSDVKMGVKWRAVEIGYPLVKVWGREVMQPKSEAEASTVEASILIEAAHLIASEEGVRLIEDSGWKHKTFEDVPLFPEGV